METGDAETESGEGTADTNTEDETGAQTHGRAAMVEDLRVLLDRIESIHPDPYHGYDGRVDLHRTVETTVRELPESATTEEFYRQVAPVIAGLNDVHSSLDSPERETDGELPLSFRVVGRSLYVDSVADQSLEELLGGRVRRIGTQPTERLVERGRALYGAENDYWAYHQVGLSLSAFGSVDRLLGRPAPSSLGLTVETPGGNEHQQTVTPVGTEQSGDDTGQREADRQVQRLDSTVSVPNGSGPRYRLYEGGDAALFVPGELQGYREAIEAARARGAEYTETVARTAYERHVGGDVPESLDSVVDALPSMVEQLRGLVRSMAAAETGALIVDLRGNPGGDSRFMFFLGYVLYGIDRLVRTMDWEIGVKRRTDPHRDRYGVPDAAQTEFATFEGNPADYDFGDSFQRRASSHEQQVERFLDDHSTGTFGEETTDRTYEGYYEPEQVVAVTDTATMSSAFAGAALLSATGADIVGVPSGQAPVSFGEAVEVTLPNTDLTASISGSIYQWTPEPDGPVVQMDAELTPDRFENRYDRADDAALRVAFDHAGVTAPGETPTPADSDRPDDPSDSGV